MLWLGLICQSEFIHEDIHCSWVCLQSVHERPNVKLLAPLRWLWHVHKGLEMSDRASEGMGVISESESLFLELVMARVV